MTRGLLAPLSRYEMRDLLGLSNGQLGAGELGPLSRKRFAMLELIAETGDGVELTALGRQRIERTAYSLSLADDPLIVQWRRSRSRRANARQASA